jgi:selenide, water dikinase
LSLRRDPNLIAGIERSEDAGVYKINDEMAIIQTVDFFTPIVDDPFLFGQIAAANALSDVYAMGGQPITALNIVCFPVGKLDITVLNETLRGGLAKMREAEVLLVGGHSVDDPEMKYGLAVTGIIHPDKVVFNVGARVGDRLILTKPVGTGIISTALKANRAPGEAVSAAAKSMGVLNASAAAAMQSVGVHAATDITGFGLLGHAAEMVADSDVGFVIEAASVPLLPGTVELAVMGMLPGGIRRNREYRQDIVSVDGRVPAYLSNILYDPQTSGGLLIAVDESKAGALLGAIKESDCDAAIIGEVVAAPVGRISVR